MTNRRPRATDENPVGADGLFVLGAGGHAKVVVAAMVASGTRLVGLLDDAPATWGCSVLGFAVGGPLVGLPDSADTRAVVAVGDGRMRRAIVDRFSRVRWSTVVHPRACVDPTAHLGDGTFVAAASVLQASSVVGTHAIVNTGATVDHDCQLGCYSHVGPGAHLAGGVSVGDGAVIGMGACVLEGRRVGLWATVGAGAVVTCDVENGAVVVGVPARPMVARGQ